ncbi:TVP38/TMEM64 family protein [Priestia filamentosa]|uniref:TVP38/TMEM64 family protein n=1 Tax=Priestia filamentosa TaxID=1402861 RepID=UPI00058919E5
MFKKIFTLIIVALVIIAAITQKNELIPLIKAGGTFSLIVGILVVATTVFFPIIPFAILAGVIGGVFGTVQGILISLTGAMLGTMLLFFLSRYGFKDWAQTKLRKYPKLEEYQRLLEKNAFFAILFVRLVPIIPSPVVNIVSGLSRVNWFVFFIASTIGKIPNIVIISIAGAHFTDNKLFSIGLYGAYFIIIFIINFIYIQRKMKKTGQLPKK